ncbi:UNVERIFIED_CONTAM: hypothetical protein PYX00_002060 [Menopon gallinae]|uniref:Caspase-1 n=1 Tax=Menopon gallinae TaxID=328185 RepID=A0AAW2IGF9_9NEOP
MNAINANNNGNQLKESILRNISNAFRIKSIEIVDNNEYIYNDIRNSSGNADDDDVFIDKEKELNYVADHFALSPGPSSTMEETIFTESMKSEEERKETGRETRPRRISDVIDCLGEDAVNLRRRSTESGGIAISPRSRTSSDLGYSGSFTSCSSFSFPPSTCSVGTGKRQNDVTDSKPFNDLQYDFVVPEAQMPVERDAEEYNMFHPRRGKAIIINNDTFDNNFATQRKGSHVDVANLKQAFSNLGFEVTIYDNWTFQEIKKAIHEISQEDHSDADCLMVAVLTHGMDNGLLYARDSLYPVESLWFPFTADNCLTLAGKPKIFFVQACRGDKLDPGVTLVSRKGSVSETDTGTAAYKIPSYSDFLIAYSSMHGFYSWRNPEDGTWFIQSVVEELKKNGSETNFLELLTRVNRRVALQFSSQNDEIPWLHEQKQVPTFHSTLIRDLIFRPKSLKI